MCRNNGGYDMTIWLIMNLKTYVVKLGVKERLNYFCTDMMKNRNGREYQFI